MLLSIDIAKSSLLLCTLDIAHMHYIIHTQSDTHLYVLYSCAPFINMGTCGHVKMLTVKYV